MKFPLLLKFYYSKVTPDTAQVNSVVTAIISLLAFALVYLALASFVLYYGYITTASCPTDPLITRQRILQADGQLHLFLTETG